MSDLMIDIQNAEYYDTIHEIMFDYSEEINHHENRTGSEIIDEFNCQKGYISKIESWIKNNPEEAQLLKQNRESFTNGIQKLNLKAWLFRKEKQSVFLPVLFLFFGAPLHIYGMINNYLPYRLPAFFVEKKVKDVHFHSSIKMALGVLLFWLFWGVQIGFVAIFTSHYIWLYYFGSLMISALFSYHYWITLLKTKGKIRYNKFSKNSNETFLTLKEIHSEIKNVLDKLYKI